MQKVAAWVIAVIVSVCIWWLALIISLDVMEWMYAQNATHLTESWVVKARQYHGIKKSYEKRGIHYFVRKGKAIKLPKGASYEHN